MNDVKPQGAGSPTILWASVILFGLFGVQIGYQIYYVTHRHMEVDTDLGAELADAVFVEEEPASAEYGWPQWRGPHRDGVVRMADLAATWPEKGPPLLWKKDIPLGYSSFAVKDGRLYSLFQQNEKEVVACWRVQDGEEVWRHEYDCLSSVHDYPGPRSTPTLDEDRLYTVGSDGTFLCLNASTGSPHWQKDLLSEFQASSPKWGVAFSPLIDGDLVFTSPGGRNGNSLAAFNKITGELVWKRFDDPAGYSSPVAVTIDGTRQILFFMADSLIAVRASDGEMCWRYPWETFAEVNAATPLAFKASHGQQVHDYVFISSGYDRGCALLKIVPKKDGGFQAKKVYSGKQMRSHFASPVRRGEYLFGIDDARLACLDLRTGKVVWTRSGCKKGSLLRVNDSLIVLGEEGNLWLLDASAEKRELKADARPFRSRCWTMPVLAEGKLLLRNEQQMQCLDLTKSLLSEGKHARGR